MPYIGLGVYKAREGGELETAIQYALQIGYRLIDTAAIYYNEGGVGKAVQDSNVERSDIFITTKLWNDRHGYDEAIKAFEESLNRLQMDYVDLYLIHWPVGGKIVETWKAFENYIRKDVHNQLGLVIF